MTRRIDALDVLRGVAILGTLGTNIWIFTAPGGALELLQFGGGGPVETFLRFLSNGKFLGLLTLLFGVGLELQYRSAVRKGMRWPGRYLWRASLLFIEGVLHYVLVFEFDVLMGYAITSVIVAYLVGRSEHAITAWMVAAGTLHLALVGLATLALATVPGGGAGAAPAYPASWPDQVRLRLDNLVTFRAELVFIVPLGIVLFLLGVRLMRAGVFDERGARLRARLMVAGLGVGAPLNLAASFAGPTWFLVDRYLLAPLVAVGLLALVTSIVLGMKGAPGVLRRGFADVGRTALSCYVFQNLVAGALCYDWGLGLAGRLDGLRPWWVPVAWAGICLLFMTLASLWLRRFDRGPLELAWQWAYQVPWRSRTHQRA
ncbi:DUF418 domain-containing protein [Nonomuraea candida]|uniref:DUF418 domain-containing protein n=1 Tax=Nonomuraea candida TaxID=359159 RepID=UPI000AA9074C|nr:DUF418 domain-containing protein [Nonomuraea candida]